jgi:hypothetical protein
MLSSISLSAQYTRITGVVKDAETGEPIPYASVYVKGTSVFAYTNDSGKYSIVTKLKIDSITVSFLGYVNQTVPVKSNVTQTINFYLQPNVTVFKEVVVRPGENPAHRIFREIQKNKKRNMPQNLDISYNRYCKILISINNIDEKFKNRKVMQPFQFVFENVDTNKYNGNTYLPVIISESSVDVYNRISPPLHKEVVKASNISGIQDQNILKFVGSLDQSFNVYNDYMDFYTESGFISPICAEGLLFYKYYLVDSAYRSGHKCYNISFKPRRKQERTFTGDFWVVDTVFAIQQLSMRLNPEANLNFITDLYAEYTYIPLNDTLWIISREYEEADINIVDSKKIRGLQGRKTLIYSNYNLNPVLPDKIMAKKGEVTVLDSAVNTKNINKYRPVALSSKEEKTYEMVDSIKKVPLFNTAYTVARTIAEAYYSVDKLKIKIGPYISFYSYNKLEGSRFSFGGITSDDFSRNVQFNGYVAYGTGDKTFKYYGNVMWIYNRDPYVKFSILQRHDVSQVNLASGELLNENIVSSFFRRLEFTKIQMIDNSALLLETDLHPNLTANFGFSLFKVQPSKYIPIIRSKDSSVVNQLNTTEFSIGLHYEKKQRFYYTTFYRYRYLNEIPAFDLNVTLGIKDLLGGQYNYAKTSFKFSKYLKTNPFGFNKYSLEVGNIFGKVPWPLLHVYKGNETYGYNSTAFNVMNYYEFVSNQYFTFLTEQHFQGIFFNYIPLLRKLKWREVASFKATIGRLTSNNYDKSIMIPSFMNVLDRPYTEIGVGIENIFKFIRIDAIYRTSYRHNPNIEPFGIRASLQFIL